MSDQPRPGRPGLALVAAGLITLPGVLLRLTGVHPRPLARRASASASAIVGAAFLLGWGAEVVQLDISAGLALAVLALIAVLPEYAVDFVFTSKAGTNPKEFAPLALANMTGANQLLIGVGWSLVVLLAAYRIKKADARGPRIRRSSRSRPGTRTDADRCRARPQPLGRDRVPDGRDRCTGSRCRSSARSRCSTRSCWSRSSSPTSCASPRAPAEEPHLVGTAAVHRRPPGARSGASPSSACSSRPRP